MPRFGVDSEFVVTAAEVLDERVPGADHPCRAELFQTAHRSQPGFQTPMIGFDGPGCAQAVDRPRTVDLIDDQQRAHAVVVGAVARRPALAAFEAGEPHLITPGKREWITLVRDRTAAGCTMQRVHVVREPITDYLRFELTWGYQPNVSAGEDIGIVPVPAGDPWPVGLPERTDFWLFDFSVLYALRYDPNDSWLAAEQVTERAAIQQARTHRDESRVEGG